MVAAIGGPEAGHGFGVLRQRFNCTSLQRQQVPLKKSYSSKLSIVLKLIHMLHGRCVSSLRGPTQTAILRVPPTRVEASHVTQTYSLPRAAQPAVGGLAMIMLHPTL